MFRSRKAVPDASPKLLDLQKLGRAGYLFHASATEAAEVDVDLGPKAAPQPLVSEGTWPDLYEPWFLELLIASLPVSGTAALNLVGQHESAVLLSFPREATSYLATLTPGRRDHVKAVIAATADRMMGDHRVTEAGYHRGGVETAVLLVRGKALAARELPGHEVFYWYWDGRHRTP